MEDADLLMIEQPLHHEDLLRHAELQALLRTDLCLDESIRSAADAAAALDLGACRIVNIKQGRVGGVLEAKRIHDLCLERGVPVWCGGMLETGVGRALNLALAALPGFTLARRHERVGAVLPRGPDRAVRAGARRHDGRPDGAGDRRDAAAGSAPSVRDPARAPPPSDKE